uniref:ABC transmembrane type-1 domain-containing protein n=1 Tax=Panagrellus redivivus TaxID=6233 RepID=A0A7E4ZZE1_PANRE
MTRVHPTSTDHPDGTFNAKKVEIDSLQNVKFEPAKNENFSEVPADYDYNDEEPQEVFEPSLCEKIINVLLCRTDLVNKKLEARPVSLIGLFRYSTLFDWILLFIGVISTICAGVSQPILAMIAGRIANVLLVYPPRSREFKNNALTNVYIFLGLGVFCTIINFLRHWCFQVSCNRIIARIRYNYVSAIIRQNAGWFDSHHSGALTTTLNENIDRIREGIGEKLSLLLRSGAMFCASVVVSYIYEWRIACVMLGVAPACCAVMSIMAQQMGNTTMKELVGVSKAGAIAEESVLGVRTVQAFNGQHEMVARYRTELEKGKRFGILKGYWSGFLGGMFFFLLFAFLGCGILYGGWLLKVRAVRNPGDVFICVMSLLLSAYFLGLISPQLAVLLNARVAAAVIYQTIDRRPKIDVYSEEGDFLQNPVGRVELKNVHFRYPTRKNAKVLNGLNLTVEPGTTVALVGHSGCGKSTSVGLLTRLYEPEKGDVLIDGVDVRKLNIHHLRNVIGIVQQEPVLFNATIDENLKIGFPDCTRERMIEVCKMANAHDFIMSFPKGYDTLIGDGGVQLSGGQKQRVAIARTLARDPKILLLDEATSALDAQSEAVVQEALDNAAKGRSTIVIAHRLSTIRHADKIVLFEKGNIAEMGNHDELVALGGRYADLVKAQQFRPEDDEEDIPLEDQAPPEPRIPAYDFPPEDSQPHLARRQFDDISRHSSDNSSFGRQSFIRGHMLNDSFSRGGNIVSTGVDMYGGVVPDELELATERAIPIETGDDIENYNIITVFKNAHGNYIFLILGFVCAMIRGLELPGLSLAFTYVFGAFTLNETDPNRMFSTCIKALGIFLGIGLGTWIFQFFSVVFFSYASENITTNLRVRAFSNVLFQDGGYFDNPAHTAGKIITRLASDAPNVKAVVDSRMLQVVYGLTAIMVGIIIAFVYSWQIALVGILQLIFLAVTQISLAFAVMKANMRIAADDEAGRIAIEIIENVKTIQLLTREQYFNEHYVKACKKLKISEMRTCIFESLNSALTQSFQFYMCCISYGLGIQIIYHGQKSPEDVFQGVVAMLLAAVAVMNSASYFPEFVKANSSARLLFSLIFRKPTTGDSSVGEKTEIRGNILFEKVKFAYPEKPNNMVMKDLNFTAIRGQTVALVGPSGTGKSTIISMLERFYDVNGGCVRIDGKDIRKLSLDHLRTQMALVGQEPRLFAGTIKENVCFGLGTTVSEDQINAALDLANARRFINNLPAGIETEVGEKGTQMSGGQKQRIAIARALVRDPKILLLDEATSALDSESERAVQEALDRARAGRTCITIAHRLSSIQNSDVILYIENGVVQEAGNHRALMSKHGKYYDLIRKQDLST